MTSREFRDRVSKRARRHEIALTPSTLAALEKYFRLLALWNSKINLTALKLEPFDEHSLDRLLIEPLIAVKYLGSSRLRVMDIGSGSGSPAIPLAIAVPGLSLTMVESKTRKAVFLMEAVRHLGIAAAVETARFEQLLTRPDLHEAMDVLTVRAVRVEARTLLSLQAFVKPQGRVFWFRSASGKLQPAAVPPPLRWVATHSLGESGASRLVVLAKENVGRSVFHVEQ